MERLQNQNDTAPVGALSEEIQDELKHWQMQWADSDHPGRIKVIDQHQVTIAYVSRSIDVNDLRALLRARLAAYQVGKVAGQEEIRRQFRALMGASGEPETTTV